MSFWTWAIWAGLGTLTISTLVPGQYQKIILIIMLLGALTYIGNKDGGLTTFFNTVSNGHFNGKTAS
jgi:hypothetical protein